MNITWEYIAGFFDGEGSVSMVVSAHRKTTASPKVHIGQSGKEGLAVLSAIQAFLVDQTIHGYIFSQKNHGRCRQMHGIQVCARADVDKFLHAIIPFVRVKKVIVQDAIRHLKMFPPLRAPKVNRGKMGAIGLVRDQVVKDVIELGTQKAVAQKYGVDPTTVSMCLRPELRTKRYANRRAWERRQQQLSTQPQGDC